MLRFPLSEIGDLKVTDAKCMCMSRELNVYLYIYSVLVSCAWYVIEVSAYL